MRLDHLLSKEHAPRPLPGRLGHEVCSGAWWCLASGIVDEELPWWGSPLSTARLHCVSAVWVGVEPGGCLAGVVLARCWVLRHRPSGGFFWPPWGSGSSGPGSLGGLVSCELDSGREHLAVARHVGR